MKIKLPMKYAVIAIAVNWLLVVPVSADHKDKKKFPLSEGNKVYHSIEQGLHGDKVKTFTDAICEGFGPQTPRDIDNKTGDNKRIFNFAPASKDLNLCNIHLHKNAEHKAKDFSFYAGDGDGEGYKSGYQCNVSKKLSKRELSPTKQKVCDSFKHSEKCR